MTDMKLLSVMLPTCTDNANESPNYFFMETGKVEEFIDGLGKVEEFIDGLGKSERKVEKSTKATGFFARENWYFVSN